MRCAEELLKGPRTVKNFLGMMLEEMYKLCFGPQIECLDTTEDVGLSCNHPDTQVNTSVTEHTILYVYYNIILKKSLF